MRKKISVLMMLCMLMCLIAGCGKDSGKGGEKTTTGGSEEVNTELTEGNEIYEQLFDINNPISIQIEISDEELNKLQEDYEEYDRKHSKSPIYRMADKVIISVGDEVYEIEEVGIRIKGNTSRVPIYDEETGEPNLSHYRLSFTETFDDETYYGDDAKVWASDEERQARKDRRFATLKGMEIKWNKNYDDTHIREIYAYDIFRDMGILAQRVNLCSMGMNGENYGVVNIYEPVDKIFIERNLPEEDWGGDLYKCAWTYKPANYVKSTVTYGVEDADTGKSYNFDLKTNKSSSTFDTLKKLLDTMDKDTITEQDFDSVVDADYFAKFLAASYFTGNPDDIRNNYNNHYVYFLGSTGKAIFIPYDYDRCLGLTYGWNPEGTGMTEVSPYSEYAEGNNSSQQNPIIDAAILEDDAFCLDSYNEALKTIAASDWLKESKFEEYYDKAKENYEDVVEVSKKFANMDMQFKFSLDGNFVEDDSDNMSFKEYTEELLKSYNAAIANN